MNVTIGNPTVGDQIPFFNLPATTGADFGPADLVGKAALLLVYPSENLPACARTLEAMRDSFEQFQSRGVRVLGISMSPPDAQKAFAEREKLPFPLVSEPQLRMLGLLGALRPKTGQPESEKLEFAALRRSVLIGPDLRVLAIRDNPDPDKHVAELLAEIDALVHIEPPRRIVNHAPVLLIPNVVPPELCKRLIEMWETQGNVDSGFMRQVDGQTVGIYDYSHKIRRDHFLKPGPELEQLKRLIGSRVVPPIRVAFNYEVSRFEDFRVACYDSSRGGFFRPHRDNTTDGTAHRRFAMSLLLNDDYEGGCVRFPEYGLHEYRPGAGGAVIFSCSLLHEATDVTAGRRFVLLSFLYGEREAKIREEYNRRTGGNYRASTAAKE